MIMRGKIVIFQKPFETNLIRIIQIALFIFFATKILSNMYFCLMTTANLKNEKALVSLC